MMLDFVKRLAIVLAYVLAFVLIEVFARVFFDHEMDTTQMLAIAALFVALGREEEAA